MEKRINKKIEVYVSELKNKLRTFIHSKDDFLIKTSLLIILIVVNA